MTKISVLFKPARSGVNNVLEIGGFYEYSYLNFMGIIPSQLKYKKIRIRKVRVEQIFDLFKYIKLNFIGNDYIFVILCSIQDLFGDEEIEEFQRNNIYFIDEK